MNIVLELKLDYRYYFGISNQWTKYRKSLSSDPSGHTACYSCGWFYYIRPSHVMDYVYQCKTKEDINKLLEWHSVDSVSKLVEQEKQWLPKRQFLKFMRQAKIYDKTYN